MLCFNSLCFVLISSWGTCWCVPLLHSRWPYQHHSTLDFLYHPISLGTVFCLDVSLHPWLLVSCICWNPQHCLRIGWQSCQSWSSLFVPLLLSVVMGIHCCWLGLFYRLLSSQCPIVLFHCPIVVVPQRVPGNGERPESGRGRCQRCHWQQYK